MPVDERYLGESRDCSVDQPTLHWAICTDPTRLFSLDPRGPREESHQ